MNTWNPSTLQKFLGVFGRRLTTTMLFALAFNSSAPALDQNHFFQNALRSYQNKDQVQALSQIWDGLKTQPEEPLKANFLILLGLNDLEQGDVFQAKVILIGLKAIYPDNQLEPKFIFLESLIHEKSNMLDKSRTVLEKINTPESLYRQAWLLFDNKQDFAALSKFQELTEKFPGTPAAEWALIINAAIKIKLQRWGDAAAALQKIQTFSVPQLRVFHQALQGLLQMGQGNNQTAYGIFTDLIPQTDGEDKRRLQILKADVALKLGRREETVATVVGLVKTSSQPDAIALALKVMSADLEKKDFPTVLALCNEVLPALKSSSEQARFLTLRALAHEASHHSQMAQQDFQSVVSKRDPQWSGRALVLLGTSLWNDNAYDQLVSDYWNQTKKLSAEKFVKPDVEIEETSLIIGSAALMLRRPADAEHVFKEALTKTLSPHLSAQMVCGLINALVQLEKFAEADKKLDELLVRFGEDRDVIRFGLLAQGHLAWNKGDAAKAHEHYAKFQDLFPDDGQAALALYMAGKSAEKNKQFPEAMQAWQLLREKYATSPYAYQALVRQARLASKTNQTELAQSLYQQVMQGTNTKAAEMALYELGESHLRSSDPVQALHIFDQYTAQFPLSSYKNSAVQNIKASYERIAKTQPEKLAALSKEYATAFHGGEVAYWSGLKKYDQGNHALALAFFDSMLTQFPQSPSRENALFYKGQCEYQLKKYGDAWKTLNEFLTSSPDHDLAVLAHFQRARCAVKLGYLDEAVNEYRKVDKLAPSSEFGAEAGFQEAMLLSQQKDWKGFEDRLIRFVADYPDHPRSNEAHWDLAQLKKRQGHYSEALSYLQRVTPASGVVSTTELAELKTSLEKLQPDMVKK